MTGGMENVLETSFVRWRAPSVQCSPCIHMVLDMFRMSKCDKDFQLRVVNVISAVVISDFIDRKPSVYCRYRFMLSRRYQTRLQEYLSILNVHVDYWNLFSKLVKWCLQFAHNKISINARINHATLCTSTSIKSHFRWGEKPTAFDIIIKSLPTDRYIISF